MILHNTVSYKFKKLRWYTNIALVYKHYVGIQTLRWYTNIYIDDFIYKHPNNNFSNHERSDAHNLPELIEVSLCVIESLFTPPLASICYCVSTPCTRRSSRF